MEGFLLRKLMEIAEDSSSSDSSRASDGIEEILVQVSHNTRIRNYASEIVPSYSDEDFKSHFHISRSSVEKLICELKSDIQIRGRPKVPLKEALLLTIWMLATQETVRSVGNRFGFSRGHTHRIFIDTCKLLTSNMENYIVWPKGQAAIDNVESFKSLRGEGSFQGVFGCLDCTHVLIPGPKGDNSYYNRKGLHSVILQGICNSKMEFINVFTGWPGSSLHSGVWKNSEVYRLLSEEIDSLLPRGTFLLGDSAYPLEKFLMVPFKDNGHLTKMQHKFNRKLSSAWVLIEQAFMRLKGQFRKLKYINVSNLEYVKYIILSSCILHNISLKDGVTYVDEGSDNDDLDIDEIDDKPYFNLEAIEIRNTIMNSFSC